MIIEPGTTLDRYIIDGVVGRGGMAIVYRGHHVQLGTPVAIKVLTVLSPDVQLRLMNEGRTQGRLRHPNIVGVLDVVALHQFPCLVMELVDGPNLATLITRHRPSLEQCDMLARGILEGVAEAHRAGVIHRDLKPENVLVEVSWSGLVPKVTDFGLVKTIRGSDLGMSATRTGTAMGTPSYMAPEQFRDAGRVDARADIFSLGAVLYELVTGRQAFRGGDLISVYQASSTNTWVPVEELAPDAPRRMLDAIRGALNPDLDGRFSSVEQLLEVWTNGGEAVRVDGRVTGIWTSPELDAARKLSPVAVLHATISPEAAPQDPAPDPAMDPPQGPVTDPKLSLHEVIEKPAHRTRRISDTPRAAATLHLAEGAVEAWDHPPKGGSPSRRWALLAGVVLALGAGLYFGFVVPDEGPTPDPTPTFTEPAPAGLQAGPELPILSPTPGEAPPAPGPDVPAAVVPAAVVPAAVVPGASRPSPGASASVTTTPVASSADEERRASTEPVSNSAPDALAGGGSTAAKVRLRVNSRPAPQEVSVDGAVLPWPAQGVELPPGNHIVEIRTGDGRTTQVDVRLLADQPLVYCWDFDLKATCQR